MDCSAISEIGTFCGYEKSSTPLSNPTQYYSWVYVTDVAYSRSERYIAVLTNFRKNINREVIN